MADPTPSQSSMARRSSSWPLGLLTLILAPVAAAMLLYQLDPYDPAPVPIHEFSQQPMVVPKLNSRMLQGSEMIGVGKLLGPEDIAYHPDSHLIYTGCADGWVKRVTLNDSVVQNWAFTGGRPLGVALGRHGQLIVADAEKGLLEVTTDGMVKTLTDEAEEGRPHGRLMSFDPSTKETKVLVRDLFFANGVIVSPDQNSVIFCESVMKMCLKYYIQGERKGSMDKFIDNLSGTPDNILYDGEGHYWIALPMGNSLAWDLALKYPWIRKVVAIMERYKVRPHMEKNGGVLVVDLEGNPTAYYYDPGLSEVTSGVKIGNHLYCGSITTRYMIRLDIHQHAARATM
ncbi:Protein strictosidine synthase-like 5 [Vitis vinifera]|uniref:Protein strictosidine synthase-like 5 n=1 Tax=Vitis vinifera TaxID=29760 RepID=A0A438GEW2_VITVI|nr:Protein strictosidine synthase-like 5 [Vitis vinifera]